MKRWASLIAAFMLLIPAAYAAETGYTLKATELKAKPFLDADLVTTIPEKTQVEIITRQGAWMQVKIKDQQQGWVRMLSVRLGNPDQKPQGGNLLSSIAAASRPRPTTTATVTTGVRGFSEEDLAKAAPNAAEVAKMKGYSVAAAEATQFAEGGKLAAREVAYFDEQGKPLKEKK